MTTKPDEDPVLHYLSQALDALVDTGVVFRHYETPMVAQREAVRHVIKAMRLMREEQIRANESIVAINTLLRKGGL